MHASQLKRKKIIDINLKRTKQANNQQNNETMHLPVCLFLSQYEVALPNKTYTMYTIKMFITTIITCACMLSTIKIVHEKSSEHGAP